MCGNSALGWDPGKLKMKKTYLTSLPGRHIVMMTSVAMPVQQGEKGKHFAGVKVSLMQREQHLSTCAPALKGWKGMGDSCS